MTKYHFFLRFFFKVLIWFSQGLQCKALPVSYDGKMEKIVDYNGAFSALLTDFSKAFDYNPHTLFIAKLEAYGFQTDALNLVYNYLSNRKQKVKIKTFSC